MSTNNDPTTTAAAQRATKRRRRKALLASGAVLGVGAVITLAAWNDSVWGNSMFGTGDNSWNVEASFDGGTTWDDFVEQGDAGSMQFNLDQVDPGNLMPGDKVSAVVGLKETDGNMDSEITVKAPVVSPLPNTLADNLFVEIEDLGSQKGGAGTIILLDSALSSGNHSNTVTLPAGTTKYLKFTVELPDGTQPSKLAKEVNASWEIDALSVDNQTP